MFKEIFPDVEKTLINLLHNSDTLQLKLKKKLILKTYTKKY